MRYLPTAAGLLLLACATTHAAIPKACPLPYRAEGLTDADGRFVFGPLGDGTFTVSVQKAGLTGIVPVTVELQAGADTEAPPLVLERGATVALVKVLEGSSVYSGGDGSPSGRSTSPPARS